MKEKKEVKLDKSYLKLNDLVKKGLTKEKLTKFMEENPDLIVHVTADRVQKSHDQLKKFMETDPIGKQILEEDEKILDKKITKKIKEM